MMKCYKLVNINTQDVVVSYPDEEKHNETPPSIKTEEEEKTGGDVRWYPPGSDPPVSGTVPAPVPANGTVPVPVSRRRRKKEGLHEYHRGSIIL
jgi:hypothetical protein